MRLRRLDILLWYRKEKQLAQAPLDLRPRSRIQQTGSVCFSYDELTDVLAFARWRDDHFLVRARGTLNF